MFTVSKGLDMIKSDAEDLTPDAEAARDLWQTGAAFAVAQIGSLRGPEVMMVELAGIRTHLDSGKDGFMPDNPLEDGVDLFRAPHVFLAMIGKCKGKLV